MNWLKHDHHQFESAIYRCRNLCDQKDWNTLRRLLDDFITCYESHVRTEEDVLFLILRSPSKSLSGTHQVTEGRSFTNISLAQIYQEAA